MFHVKHVLAYFGYNFFTADFDNKQLKIFFDIN